MNSNTPSPKTRQEAMKMAKAIQKQGQTKEQTKLIAQGIEKGIALYKAQQKNKAHEIDKKRKKQRKATLTADHQQATAIDVPTPAQTKAPIVPWMLLVLSWIGFIIYLLNVSFTA